jgi:hypothetical protein
VSSSNAGSKSGSPSLGWIAVGAVVAFLLFKGSIGGAMTGVLMAIGLPILVLLLLWPTRREIAENTQFAPVVRETGSSLEKVAMGYKAEQANRHNERYERHLGGRRFLAVIAALGMLVAVVVMLF